MSAPCVADARLLGELYQHLGGAFAINGEGKRVMFRQFEPVHGKLCGLNREDWQRVARIVEDSIHSLPWDLRLWIFDAFATVEPDPETITCLYSEPTRRAA